MGLGGGGGGVSGTEQVISSNFVDQNLEWAGEKGNILKNGFNEISKFGL